MLVERKNEIENEVHDKLYRKMVLFFDWYIEFGRYYTSRFVIKQPLSNDKIYEFIDIMSYINKCDITNVHYLKDLIFINSVKKATIEYDGITIIIEVDVKTGSIDFEYIDNNDRYLFNIDTISTGNLKRLDKINDILNKFIKKYYKVYFFS